MSEQSIGERSEDECQRWCCKFMNERMNRQGFKDVPTSTGNQFCHRAQERMINRKPTASTKDRRITALNWLEKQNYKRKTVLRNPAAIDVIAVMERRITCLCCGSGRIIIYYYIIQKSK